MLKIVSYFASSAIVPSPASRIIGALSVVPLPPNKSLQRTFDPPPIFAAAKTGVASNAAELRR